MNEIERFKKSRMIPKGQGGLKAGDIGYWKQFAVKYDGSQWIIEVNGKPVPAGEAANVKPRSSSWSNHLGYRASFSSQAAQGAYNQQVRAGLRDPNQDVRLPWQTSPETPVDRTGVPSVVPDEYVEDYRSRNTPTNTTRTGGRVRSTVRRPKFVSRLGDLNLTAEEKAFLEGQGVNVNDATSMQNFILKNAANADLGARKGAGIADGYFGDKSLKAFQALRNQGIFAPKIDAQERITAVNTVPADAPDFGYATNQDYSDGSQFKGLGFNNYQGLLLYAQNSQDQFAKDLRQRFGNRLTDQNYVESQLGISGKYRGGNAGDFGDMARSMQAWKTGVNNEFDKKRADYAQARLAERTDPTNGMVYSSPEMMRKFQSIKVSPEVRFGGNRFDFSNMKYNLNFGNTGANTLGGIGTLGGGELS